MKRDGLGLIKYLNFNHTSGETAQYMHTCLIDDWGCLIRTANSLRAWVLLRQKEMIWKERAYWMIHKCFITFVLLRVNILTFYLKRRIYLSFHQNYIDVAYCWSLKSLILKWCFSCHLYWFVVIWCKQIDTLSKSCVCKIHLLSHSHFLSVRSSTVALRVLVKSRQIQLRRGEGAFW